MTPAELASAAALAFECKKDSMRQNQDGTWKVTFTLQPMDVPRSLTEAMPGTRYQAVIVAIGDDEMPLKPESEVMPSGNESKRQHIEADARPGQESLRPDRAKHPWQDVPASQQAGIRCHEPAFASFLMEEHSSEWRECYVEAASDEDNAAECVRFICGITSRADLRSSETAKTIWIGLNDQFEAWLRVGA